MVAAFVILGLGTVALATGLFLVNARTTRAKTDFLLLVAFGVSLILAGLFKTDRVGSEATGSGVVHAAASMIGLTVAILAMAQWTRQMKADSQLISYARVLAKLTFLSAVLFVLFLLSGGLAAGLVQRVFLTSILAWQLYATRAVLAGPLTPVSP